MANLVTSEYTGCRNASTPAARAGITFMLKMSLATCSAARFILSEQLIDGKLFTCDSEVEDVVAVHLPPPSGNDVIYENVSVGAAL